MKKKTRKNDGERETAGYAGAMPLRFADYGADTPDATAAVQPLTLMRSWLKKKKKNCGLCPANRERARAPTQQRQLVGRMPASMDGRARGLHSSLDLTGALPLRSFLFLLCITVCEVVAQPAAIRTTAATTAMDGGGRKRKREEQQEQEELDPAVPQPEKKKKKKKKKSKSKDDEAPADMPVGEIRLFIFILFSLAAPL